MTKTRSRLVGILVVVGLIILSAFLLAQSANAQVMPMYPGMGDSVEISTFSGAIVLNDVDTKANTGGNTADGSYAGDGGDGGEIENSGGEQDIEGTTTGDGGMGGDAGLGGAVQTGDALAVTNLGNVVNTNDIEVDGCGCEEEDEEVSPLPSRVRVSTFDLALVANRVDTKTNTGDNYADGSYAGEGGDGGDIENGDHYDGYHGPPVKSNGDDNGDEADQEVDDSTTGTGGDGGAGSDGGVVLTGDTTSRTTIANIINSNLIRVRG